MKEIHPLLDEKGQIRARLYEKEKRLLGLSARVLSFAIVLIFYVSGLSALLAGLNVGHSVIGTFLIYVITFYAILTILSFPLGFYSGYIHEHKWNFSNHTVKSWLWEQIKSIGIGLLFLNLILGLLFWSMTLTVDWWWLLAALAMAFVSGVLATLFPIVIAPIFNKYTPIHDEKLTAALDEMLARAGLKSSGIFKEDMSRQTKKENAFLAGLGKTRRIVLGDNLLENMSTPEIESIIAHEVGHHKYRHIWKMIGIGSLQQLLIFFLIHLVLKQFFPYFLSSTQANLSLFPVFAILWGGISGFLLSPLNNFLSRDFEKKADKYALDNIQNKRSFMTALAGLANRNLSNAYPEWWVKILFYSHPPIGERLEMAKKMESIHQEDRK
jgi:STE24 endopeptidase